LNIGQGIDRDGIEASYNNGVLSVTIPVSEKAKPRKIQVTHGSSANSDHAITVQESSSKHHSNTTP
jgi:HSP20 family protein